MSHCGPFLSTFILINEYDDDDDFNDAALGDSDNVGLMVMMMTNKLYVHFSDRQLQVQHSASHKTSDIATWNFGISFDLRSVIVS